MTATHATRNDLAAAIKRIASLMEGGHDTTDAIREAEHLASLPASRPKATPVQGDWRVCDTRTSSERWLAGEAAPNVGKKSKRGSRYHRVRVLFEDGTEVRTGTYDTDKSGVPDTASCVRSARQIRMNQQLQAEDPNIREQLENLSRRSLEIEKKLSKSPEDRRSLLNEQQELDEKAQKLHAHLHSEGEFVWTLDGWRRPRVADIPDVSSVERIEEPIDS